MAKLQKFENWRNFRIIFQIDFQKIEKIENFWFSNFEVLNVGFGAPIWKSPEAHSSRISRLSFFRTFPDGCLWIYSIPDMQKQNANTKSYGKMKRCDVLYDQNTNLIKWHYKITLSLEVMFCKKLIFFIMKDNLMKLKLQPSFT